MKRKLITLSISILLFLVFNINSYANVDTNKVDELIKTRVSIKESPIRGLVLLEKVENVRKSLYTSQNAMEECIVIYEQKKDYYLNKISESSGLENWFKGYERYLYVFESEIEYVEGLVSGTALNLSEIYETNMPDNPTIKAKDVITNTLKKNDKPGSLEKKLSELVVGLSDAIYSWIKDYGLDIDTLIYNKSPDYELVQTHDSNGTPYVLQYGETSYFKIDFRNTTQSPFAAMGLTLYSLFSFMAYVSMFLIYIILNIRLQANVITKNQLAVKDAALYFVLAMILIFNGPKLMNLFSWLLNYLVDIFNPANAGLGGFNISLHNLASTSKRLADALVYAGSVGISLFYAFSYASRALHIALFFFLFPIMALFLNGQKFRKKFDEYLGDFFSTLMIQVIDAALFFSLAYIFSVGGIMDVSGNGFIKLLIAFGILPCRRLARKLLGFSNGSAASDMLGVAGVIGATRLVTGALGGAKGLVSGITGGISDIRDAGRAHSMYSDSSSTNTNETNYGEGSQQATGYSTRSTSGINYSEPDISPYMPNIVGQKGSLRYDSGSVDDKIRDLRTQGYKKVFSSVLRSGLGVTGGITGAGLGTFYGATGAIYGANIGGSLGAGVGDIAGNMSGQAFGTLFNDHEQFGNSDKSQPNININDTSTDTNQNAVVPRAVSATQPYAEGKSFVLSNVAISSPEANFDIAMEISNNIKNMSPNMRDSIANQVQTEFPHLEGEALSNAIHQKTLYTAVESVMRERFSDGFIDIDVTQFANYIKNEAQKMKNGFSDSGVSYEDLNAEDVV